MEQYLKVVYHCYQKRVESLSISPDPQLIMLNAVIIIMGARLAAGGHKPRQETTLKDRDVYLDAIFWQATKQES